ncbi:MAG TPA: glycosyltransferase family 9 protein [Pyrinomonadaceae bacterium]|jgi:ADP-heptose:LPS heptosyltransferase|nr:glycosyltransferase family 9 protein [Pyrinomonadaceae bacterium]
MSFDPRNILVIDFGQLGDVVLSLPALSAVRQRFPRARVTVAVGGSAAPVVELSGVADEALAVDRVALRDGPKHLSVWQIGKLVLEVRRRKFDFVIDLHSLSETNLLGFLSGAPQRLYARRPTRSLDYLSNFKPPPPVEDRKKHAIDRYLDVLAPLGIGEVSRVPRLPVREEDSRAVVEMLRKAKAAGDAPLVGIFPGAGHPSRRWPVERFAELAWMLERNDSVRTILFAGPEERQLVRDARAKFPPTAVVLDRLNVPQLAAAAARLSLFVSNDTGPMHVAAAVGTPVVILMQHHPMFDCYIPPGERHRVVAARTIEAITVEAAYAAARAAFTAERASSLFSD